MLKIYVLGLISLLVTFTACVSESTTVDPSVRPAENRFTTEVITEGMDEPMEMTFLPNDRVLFVERKGGVKIVDENSGEVHLVTTIPVNTKYKNKEGRVREAEEGLMGVIADPNYASNNWIYMYYADPDTPKHVLARWELNGTTLNDASKKVLLEVPTQREECCHTGGGMVFDKDGNLYLTVGNNTVNPRAGSSNLDERPGHENSDDQRAPGNTNDLRGKILRIHPEADGSYTIPEGNLFPEGTAKTRPEIYTMGHRNPWRPTLDSKTGFLFWGEVGPDAAKDSVWGPRGYDEFNRAKSAGNFGWPYFIGNNLPYNRHDHVNETYGEPYDPQNPVNESVNNTGLRELPPAEPAFIWYPYGPSEEFPLVGSAGRSATGGPVFRMQDFKDAEHPFPAYYEGKWLITEFMRGWIMAVTMDENGDYVSMERFLPGQLFSSAIDMDFGPSGDLYVLEYGSAWFRGNSNSKLVRIRYNAGNRAPNVMASVDKSAGGVPLTVQLSSEGTNDFDEYDAGKLKYNWTVSNDGGYDESFIEPNPKLTLDQPGTYKVSLSVTDSKGASASDALEIVAGNEPPVVNVMLKDANRSFYFGDKELSYEVSVSDDEDGSVGSGIQDNEVSVTFDFIPPGYDPIEVASNQSGADAVAKNAIGKNLIAGSDCRSCHQDKVTSIGPSYLQVAEKYEATEENIAMLIKGVIGGSSGKWGEHAMSAHPTLDEADARKMIDYILELDDEQATVKKLPLAGVVKPEIPEDQSEDYGGFLLRAAYADKGANAQPSLASESFIALRNPRLIPYEAEIQKGTELLTTPRITFNAVGPESYFGYEALDLTGVKQINIRATASMRSNAAGGIIEVRLDSPTGQLLGQSGEVVPAERGWRAPPPPPEMIEISAVEGVHDVYFVVKSPQASDVQTSMSFSFVEFLNKIGEQESM